MGTWLGLVPKHKPQFLASAKFHKHGSKKLGSGGIRTHASEETGALNQRLRPLGHATLYLSRPTVVEPTESTAQQIHQLGLTLLGALVTSLYSSVAERWSCKPKVMSSILIGGSYIFCSFLCWAPKNFDPDVIRTRSLLIWSQTRYRCATESINEVLPRFELGSLDSKSRVLTITP